MTPRRSSLIPRPGKAPPEVEPSHILRKTTRPRATSPVARLPGRGIIALLTDFGTRDWYVGTLKAVILSRAPRARLVDITHEIPPQDTVAGAFTLAAAAPWFPPGTIFLAIVDPGVGSRRALLAVQADASYFIGPDNGLLTLSLQRAKRVRTLRLTNRRYWLPEVSRTFQARDIMAPVAASLATGVAFARLGVPMPQVASLDVPSLQRKGRTLLAHIMHIDAFGNLITNLSGHTILPPEQAGRLTIRYKRRPVRVVSSYADGRPDELVAVVGSLGFVELAVRNGSAAWTLNARRGDPVELIS